MSFIVLMALSKSHMILQNLDLKLLLSKCSNALEIAPIRILPSSNTPYCLLLVKDFYHYIDTACRVGVMGPGLYIPVLDVCCPQ